MNVVMTIGVHSPLEKTQVFEIAKIINQVYGETVVGGKGKKVATTTSRDGMTFYDFVFDVDSTEEVCDVLANELYNKLSFDFEMEIDCEVTEDFLAGRGCGVDSDEESILIEDEPSKRHSQWISQRLHDGWHFGTEFSEDHKRDPLMRPYHALSARQQAIALRNHQR